MSEYSCRRHDFIETADGLIFAVVTSGVEEGRVLCFLRYVRSNGTLTKVDTAAANELLQSHYRGYVFHSTSRDATLHGVPIDRITTHYSASERAAALAAGEGTSPTARRCGRLIDELTRLGVSLPGIGVTGSLIIGAESDKSDIDLVIYDRDLFHHARGQLVAGCADGTFTPLSVEQWQQTYRRRGCSLSFDDYLWHERRKNNKAVFEGTKFDISLEACSDRTDTPSSSARKLRPATIVATITDDTDAFAFPARWRVDHSDVSEVFVFTPTYIGQAFAGEKIEAAGMIELTAEGGRQLVIGSSREAPGQWLKVIR